MHRLFIYGTLAPGRTNHDVVSDIDGSWEKASVRGTLYEQGWGSDLGCPGMIPSDDGDIIDGFLLSSEHLAEHWPRLDRFEGADYQRVTVSVTTESGENLEAQVYSVLSSDQ